MNAVEFTPLFALEWFLVALEISGVLHEEQQLSNSGPSTPSYLPQKLSKSIMGLMIKNFGVPAI